MSKEGLGEEQAAAEGSLPESILRQLVIPTVKRDHQACGYLFPGNPGPTRDRFPPENAPKCLLPGGPVGA